jgi:transposase
MNEREFYQQVLGLSKPWKVKAVRMELAQRKIVVEVECEDEIWGNPSTGQRAQIHEWNLRRWRHLDTCQFETIIEAKVPRLRYEDGSTEEVSVPWAERYSRLSKLMESFVIQVVEGCRSVKEAAALVGLGVDQVDGVMARAVKRGLERRKAEAMTYLGMDEKGISRGHRYATLLNDLVGGRVWEVVEGRKQQDADELWKSLSLQQRQQVRAVAMDMWPAYLNSVKQALPQADVVHDRFHIAKHFNEAVDKVRKAEHRALLYEGDDLLKGTKYDWLRRHPDLRRSEANVFRLLHHLNLKTSRAWRYKESFEGFWQYRLLGPAKGFLMDWYASAIRSRLEPIKAVARMLKSHATELLNYITHRITNAASEGLNSTIQLIRANARGLPNFKNFRTRILFYCGKLDMLPA